MNSKSTHFTLLLSTLTVIINHSRYVHGVGYQGSDRRHKEADNSDNSGPANYNFEYGIDDGGHGPQFGHQEERNGHQTRGRYSVLLPDGRLQVVNYKADQNGYVAEITYENGPAQSSNDGYSNMGKYGSENVATAATSYGPPPPPPTQYNDHSNKGGGYSDNQKGFRSGKGGANRGFGSKNSNSRSFVKLRRTVDGKQFNYMY